jgi:hypothetical protein
VDAGADLLRKNKEGVCAKDMYGKHTALAITIYIYICMYVCIYIFVFSLLSIHLYVCSHTATYAHVRQAHSARKLYTSVRVFSYYYYTPMYVLSNSEPPHLRRYGKHTALANKLKAWGLLQQEINDPPVDIAALHDVATGTQIYLRYY